MVIWKYPLEMVNKQTLNLPSSAQILTVQVQDKTPQLWTLCEGVPGYPTTERTILMYGTGWFVPNNANRYIATFQLEGGRLVFQVFEEKEQ